MIHITVRGPAYNEPQFWLVECDHCKLCSPYFVIPAEAIAWLRAHLSTAHTPPRHAARRTRAER